MPNEYVEEGPDGTWNVRDKNGNVISQGHKTQKDAIDRAEQLNPGGQPDVERVRHTPKGEPDKWRPAHD